MQVRHTVDSPQPVEHRFGYRVVHRQDHHRATARSIPADEHARDVDVVLAEDRAHSTDHSRPVLVAADQEASIGHEVHTKSVDANHTRLVHQHGARKLVALHAQGDETRVAAMRVTTALDDLDSATGSYQARVHRVDAVLGKALEHTLDSRRHEQVHVVLRQLALELELDRTDASTEELRVQRGEPFGQVCEW